MGSVALLLQVLVGGAHLGALRLPSLPGVLRADLLLELVLVALLLLEGSLLLLLLLQKFDRGLPSRRPLRCERGRCGAVRLLVRMRARWLLVVVIVRVLLGLQAKALIGWPLRRSMPVRCALLEVKRSSRVVLLCGWGVDASMHPSLRIHVLLLHLHLLVGPETFVALLAMQRPVAPLSESRASVRLAAAVEVGIAWVGMARERLEPRALPRITALQPLDFTRLLELRRAQRCRGHGGALRLTREVLIRAMVLVGLALGHRVVHLCGARTVAVLVEELDVRLLLRALGLQEGAVGRSLVCQDRPSAAAHHMVQDTQNSPWCSDTRRVGAPTTWGRV